MSERARRIGPAIVLLSFALIPALGFGALWRWADEAQGPPTTTTTTTLPTGPPAPTMSTSLLSLRRAPAPLAERAQQDAYRAVVDEFLAGIDDQTCAAVSVDGELVGAANPAVPLVPASNQKLLVAAVALDVLGPDHRFVTEVRGGPIVNGVLAGDLYLVGGGDPALLSAQVGGATLDPAAGLTVTSFDALADALVAQGLVRIEGDVVGDGSRYDDEFVVPSWGPDITRADAGPYDALLANDGLLFGSGRGLDPNQAAASELNRLLVARGVTITGRNRTDPAPPGLGVLASVPSADLRTVVRDLLHTSDNNTAELLVKEIGVATSASGTRPAGLDAVRSTLAAWGVPLDGVVLDDGSGLSRVNRLTCSALLGLVEHVVVAEPPWADAFVAALPVAATSGTLTDQLVGTPAAGVLRAKTGTLTGVKALSGVYPGDDGEDLAFALVSNTPGVDDPAVHVPVWQALVSVLDRYPVGPAEADLAPR